MKKKKNVFRCFKVIIFAKKNGILYRKKIEIGQPMDRLALHKKMKSSFKDFLSKYEQIGRVLGIYLHLLKKQSDEKFQFLNMQSELVTKHS